MKERDFNCCNYIVINDLLYELISKSLSTLLYQTVFVPHNLVQFKLFYFIVKQVGSPVVHFLQLLWVSL